MKTTEQLGKLVKAKHPRYRHLSDLDAGREAKRDYPGRYDDFTDVVQPALNTPNLDHLFDLYKPGRGKFTSWLHNRKFASRLELIQNVNTEVKALIEQGAILENAVNAKAMAEVEYKTWIRSKAGELQLLEEAFAEGLDYETSQRVKALRVESDIRVDEYRRMAQVDMERSFAEKRETVRTALIGKEMKEHQKLFLIQELLDQLHTQIHDIQQSVFPPEVQNKMIEDRQATIRAFQADKDARERRLLQADNGQDLRGGLPVPELGE